MPSAMSSRERLLAALRREPVDYVPCCGFFNPLTEVQRRGYTWNFPWPPEASWEEQVTYQVEQLGLDEMAPIGVTITQPDPEVTSRI